MKIFSREIIITFIDTGFSILTKQKNGEKEGYSEFDLDKIYAYNIQFPNSNFVRIVFF
jgi:hypothetical protein